MKILVIGIVWWGAALIAQGQELALVTRAGERCDLIPECSPEYLTGIAYGGEPTRTIPPETEFWAQLKTPRDRGPSISARLYFPRGERSIRLYRQPATGAGVSDYIYLSKPLVAYSPGATPADDLSRVDRSFLERKLDLVAVPMGKASALARLWVWVERQIFSLTDAWSRILKT